MDKEAVVSRIVDAVNMVVGNAYFDIDSDDFCGDFDISWDNTVSYNASNVSIDSVVDMTDLMDDVKQAIADELTDFYADSIYKEMLSTLIASLDKTEATLKTIRESLKEGE